MPNGFIAQHLEDANYRLCSTFGAEKHVPSAKESLADTIKARWPKDTLIARARASLLFCAAAIEKLSDAQLADEFTVDTPTGPQTVLRARYLSMPERRGPMPDALTFQPVDAESPFTAVADLAKSLAALSRASPESRGSCEQAVAFSRVRLTATLQEVGIGTNEGKVEDRRKLPGQRGGYCGAIAVNHDPAPPAAAPPMRDESCAGAGTRRSIA